MIAGAQWNYQFSLVYSVTLNQDSLETSLVIRNTGPVNYDFQVLFHTYLAIDVSHARRGLERGANDCRIRTSQKRQSLGLRMLPL